MDKFFLTFVILIISTNVFSFSLQGLRFNNGEIDGHNREGEDFEMVHLSRDAHPKYLFNAFGKEINLHLKPNDKIVSKGFKSFLLDGNERKEIPEPTESCYFLHRDDISSAAISFCNDNQMHGYIFFEKYVLEIAPFNNSQVKNSKVHIVKRNVIEKRIWDDEFDVPPMNFLKPEGYLKSHSATRWKRNQENPVVEAGLFFDEAAFNIFAPFFQYNIVQLRDMILAYLNGVQALYHHPSAGQQVDITLTHLEIFRSQPHDLVHHDGEADKLLDSFCDYHQKHNPPQDEDPKHWDIGLYVSGLDFYAMKKGRRSGVTMGLAVVGGICETKYACVLAEFGVTNIFGKPYPSAGFTSVFILAHEIGHSLGMHHDGDSNSCEKEGYIMSPSRSTVGETLWSVCSAQVLHSLNTWANCLYDKPSIQSELDHRKFQNTPGLVWNLKKQCELLLKDKDAEVIRIGNEEDVCQSVQCKTPHRAGFYFAGPAMEGTLCGTAKWCQGGECVRQLNQSSLGIIEGGWSEWNVHKCQSGCMTFSKGFQSKQRTCNNPEPQNTNNGCEGMSYQVLLCNDEKLCSKKRRQSPTDYASRMCREFSQIVNDIDTTGVGLQAPYEHERLWMSCTLFCRRSDRSSYYSPRLELNDLGVIPYFPDGTWCHHDGKYNYYCLQHHCLPENFQFHKNVDWSEDIPLPQNAPPNIIPLSDILKKYLSVDVTGNPLLRKLDPNLTFSIPEDLWASKDYIEIPLVEEN